MLVLLLGLLLVLLLNLLIVLLFYSLKMRRDVSWGSKSSLPSFSGFTKFKILVLKFLQVSFKSFYYLWSDTNSGLLESPLLRQRTFVTFGG